MIAFASVRDQATRHRRIFRNISCGPLHCQDVQDSQEPSSLSSACESNDGIQMFLSLTRGSWGLSCCVLVQVARAG